MPEKLHLQEYAALRNEVLENIRQLGELKKFFLLSVAASIAWLLSQAGRLDPATSFIGAWIPCFILFWFSSHIKDLSDNITFLGDYIRKLEVRYGADDLGWQNIVRTTKDQGREAFFRSRLFLFILQIATVIFAFYYIARYTFQIHSIPPTIQNLFQ